ncbi:Pentalenolactone D synthase [Vanrija pseudolonga]|uniref:Pentalenolactone D synthase n=1 Tax=Vanrija pseudolonga TaxID=143232 RepID=A0AAF0Y530_9TREE|nr:Pentalenolactone D synthase [Vanrija pseudolonga]
MTIENLDGEQLRQKYAEERDKRLQAPAGRKFKRLEQPGHVVDLHLPVQPREPVKDSVDFTFVGGGFSGLITSARVKEAVPNANIRILDQAGDFGGVWYWNRYPGAMCDTAAMVYMPLLEETGHMPTRKYAMGPEIHEHTRRIGRHYDLYKHALFHTAVTAVSWDADLKRWRVQTNRGDDFTTKYLTVGTGPLTVAQLPDIPGIDSFKGKAFHTSRWEYEFTGGDRSGAPLTGLADKRVAIIGTGATAIQCIPELAKYAKELLVFQRTPSAVDIRNNHDIDPEWFSKVAAEPGWQQRWLDNFTSIWALTGGRPAEIMQKYDDLVKDGWSELALRIQSVFLSLKPEERNPQGVMLAIERSDDETTSRIRARVDEVVTADPAAAEGLKAWYRQLCKRPTFHDEYLQCFNRPNVTLIDTDGQGVDRITPTGLHALGKDYDVDVIIYASGFEFQNTSFTSRLGFEITGPEGTLTDAWADGMRSLHGRQTKGFPNLFLTQLAQAARFAANVPANFLESARAIAGVVKYMEENGKQTIDVSKEAEDAWFDLIVSAAPRAQRDECTPGHYNNEGKITLDKPSPSGMGSGYPGGPVAFFQLQRDWTKRGLETGEFEGTVVA